MSSSWRGLVKLKVDLKVPAVPVGTVPPAGAVIRAAINHADGLPQVGGLRQQGRGSLLAEAALDVGFVDDLVVCVGDVHVVVTRIK